MATATKKRKGRKSSSKEAVNVFHQRLGSLTHYQAAQLLGDNGAELMRKGGQAFEIESDREVFLGGDLFRVRIEDPENVGGTAIVTMTLQSARTK